MVICEICGKELKKKQGLREHYKFIHAGATGPATAPATEPALSQLLSQH